MFGIKVGEDYLVLDPKHTFTFIKNNPLFDIDIPSGEYTYPITVSMDVPNAKVLEFLNKINAEKSWKLKDVQTFFNDIPWQSGTLKPIKATRKKLELNIKTGTSILSDYLKNTKLNQLAFPIIDTINQTGLLAHMRDTVLNPQNHNHVFAPVYNPSFFDDENYTSFINDYAPNGAVLGNFRGYEIQDYYKTAHIPFLFLKPILQKMFSDIGYTLVWDLMDTDFFGKILLVNNRPLREKTVVPAVELNYTQINFYNPESFEEIFVDIDTYWKACFADYDNYPYDLADFNAFVPLDNLHIINHFLSGVLSKNDTFNVYTQATNVYYALSDGQITIPISWTHSLPNPGAYDDVFIKIDVWVNDEFRETKMFFIYSNNYTIANTPILNSCEFSIAVSKSDSVEVRIRGFYAEDRSTPTFPDRGPKVTYYTDFELDTLSIDFIYAETQYFWNVDPVINYSNHLKNETLSDFFAAIRKRYGAYISKVNDEERIIELKQFSSILENSTAKPICEARSIDYELEVIQNSFEFVEEFASCSLQDDVVYKNQLPNTNLGDFNPREVVDLKYSPIYTHEKTELLGKSFYGAVGFPDSEAEDGSDVEMRLAIYQGIQPLVDYSIYPITPYVSWNNYNAHGTKVTDYNLSLVNEEGLFEVFLKAWFTKMLEYELYKFTLFMNFADVKKYTYDIQDFYMHQRFLIKNLDIKMKGNHILPVEAEMVKI